VQDLICLIGLLMILEGVPYFILPNGMKRLMERIPRLPDRTLRVFGFAAMLAGLFLVYLGRR
jgi:uncharacterized protein YjeT (DUF2065 family)